MKKNYFMGFIACAALTMTGCSNDEIGGNDGQTQGEPIEFGTYLGRDAQARGGVTTTDNLENFGVFAFYTGQKTWEDYAPKATPNFMNNQEVKKNGSEWSYSPLKYWPNNVDDKVSFFAYSPYDADKKWDENQKISFTVDNTVKDQQDLLACWTSANTIDLTKQAISGKVTFKFGHALSRIGLQVAYAKDATSLDNATIDGSTVISVKEVTLGNVTNGTFYGKGDLLMNADKATWTTSTSDNYQSFKLESGNFKSAVAAKVTNAYQDLNADDSYVMIIPQNLLTDGFPVTIKYTVTTTDSSNAANSSTIENTITNTAKINFEAGKAYTLNLLLGMTSVKLSASVTDWDVQDGTTVYLPQNNQ